MAAQVANWLMFGGETPLLEFGPTMDNNGNVINLTGAAIEFVIYNGNTAFATPPVVVKTNSSGVTILDQTTSKGLFTVSLVQSDTANLQGLFYYEVGIVLGGVSLVSTYGYITITACKIFSGSIPPPPPLYSPVLSITLTADTDITYTLPALDGQNLTVIISQDSVGGHVITWGSMFLLAPSDIPPDPDTIDIFSFVSSGGNWYLASTPVLGATL